MTTPLDEKLVPVAYDMLERFGFVVTYQYTTGGTYNPATGDVTGGAVNNVQLKAVPPFPVKDDLVDGDVYKFGDQLTYFAAKDLPFTPTAGEATVTFGGVAHQVVAARPIRSGELVALWELVLRKN